MENVQLVDPATIEDERIIDYYHNGEEMLDGIYMNKEDFLQVALARENARARRRIRCGPEVKKLRFPIIHQTEALALVTWLRERPDTSRKNQRYYLELARDIEETARQNAQLYSPPPLSSTSFASTSIEEEEEEEEEKEEEENHPYGYVMALAQSATALQDSLRHATVYRDICDRLASAVQAMPAFNRGGGEEEEEVRVKQRIRELGVDPDTQVTAEQFKEIGWRAARNYREAYGRAPRKVDRYVDEVGGWCPINRYTTRTAPVVLDPAIRKVLRLKKPAYEYVPPPSLSSSSDE